MLLQSDQKMHVLIQYHQREITDFHTIEAGIQKGFEKLGKQLLK